MPMKKFLREKTARIEAAMEQCVAEWTGSPPELIEAMRYSLFSGGKRLRPALCLGAAEIVSGVDNPALPAACALEMIHTYSLIHDDLPAMDNDDLRRGRPTLHKVYGEAVAILAGDSLLAMAFAVAAQGGRADIVREIAQASGPAGMAGGQYIDLTSEGKPLSLNELQRMHAMKTGALIRCAVRCGAMLAGANEAALSALTRYGEHLGLAFQIADDVLDVVGDQALIGKTVGSDAARNKQTYAGILGVENARVLAHEAAESAIDALMPFGSEANVFRSLARYVVERDS